MRVFYFEPDYRGYRQVYLDGLKQYSRHDIVSFALPEGTTSSARRNAILPFLEKVYKHQEINRPAAKGNGVLPADRVDVLVTTDPQNLNDLYALGRQWLAPMSSAVLFHEQTYLIGQSRRQSDIHAGLNLLYSTLAADRLFFNSQRHQQDCIEFLRKILARVPDFSGKGKMIPSLIKKSRIVQPGVSLRELDQWRHELKYNSPTILWNQRWEESKNPETLFQILYRLADEGLDFGVVICGKQPELDSESPRSSIASVFDEVRHRLGDRVFHYGYAKTRAEYANLLWMSDIVVSTAEADYFPTSIVEAIFCECFPLVPDRLDYPSLFPAPQRDRFIYQSTDDLYSRLKNLLLDKLEIQSVHLRREILSYDWEKAVRNFDQEIAQMNPSYRSDVITAAESKSEPRKG